VEKRYGMIGSWLLFNKLIDLWLIKFVGHINLCQFSWHMRN